MAVTLTVHDSAVVRAATIALLAAAAMPLCATEAEAALNGAKIDAVTAARGSRGLPCGTSPPPATSTAAAPTAAASSKR